MRGPLALIVEDPDGGFNVIDTRDGRALAWRSELASVNAIASRINAEYPPGAPAPAWDSLLHELIIADRHGAEPSLEAVFSAGALRCMIPDSIGGPLDNGLWKPRVEA